jgi:hypothetical protein
MIFRLEDDPVGKARLFGDAQAASKLRRRSL